MRKFSMDKEAAWFGQERLVERLLILQIGQTNSRPRALVEGPVSNKRLGQRVARSDAVAGAVQAPDLPRRVGLPRITRLMCSAR
jgi:hypothetical protein